MDHYSKTKISYLILLILYVYIHLDRNLKIDGN